MEAKKKTDPRKFRLACVLAAVLALWLAVAFLPGGARANWQKIYSFFGLGDFSACADSSPFSLHVINVGKADSLLIECGGKTMLVDGGTAEMGSTVTAYLKRRGVTSIDLLVNSHPDSDHIGGLSEVLESYTASRYLSPALPDSLIPDSGEYAAMQKALAKQNLSAEHPAAGSIFTLGSLKITVVGPVKTGSDTNNNSLVLKLTYGGTTFLLAGDAEKEEETTLLESGADLSADVLKVGHHGSSGGTTKKFLAAVMPKFAAISVGEDSNELPKLEVLERLTDIGAATYRTDLNGTIIFLSDGTNITVKTEIS